MQKNCIRLDRYTTRYVRAFGSGVYSRLGMPSRSSVAQPLALWTRREGTYLAAEVGVAIQLAMSSWNTDSLRKKANCG